MPSDPTVPIDRTARTDRTDRTDEAADAAPDVGGAEVTDAALLDAEIARLAAQDARPHGPSSTRLGLLLVILGSVGLLASFALSVERVRQLADPSYVPSCSINPFLTCGPAMGSWQGALLGFPNSFIGIMSFSVVITLGVSLLAGAVLPRWMWVGLTVVASVAVVLVHFLIGTSLFVLRAVCPWCLVVWVVTMPIWWYSVIHLLSGRAEVARAGGWLVRNRVVLLACWYVLLVVAVVVVLGDRIALVI